MIGITHLGRIGYGQRQAEIAFQQGFPLAPHGGRKQEWTEKPRKAIAGVVQFIIVVDDYHPRSGRFRRVDQSTASLAVMEYDHIEAGTGQGALENGAETVKPSVAYNPPCFFQQGDCIGDRNLPDDGKQLGIRPAGFGRIEKRHRVGQGGHAVHDGTRLVHPTAEAFHLVVIDNQYLHGNSFFQAERTSSRS